MSNEETGGPYLGAAVLCEKVLQEKDGLISAIRIIDRIIVTARGASAPGQMPKVQIDATALLLFRSGDAKGSYNVTVTPIAPSGMRGQEVSLPMLLEGEERGVNIIINLRVEAMEEGVYWFDVRCQDELVTRVPLRVIYQRIGLGSPGTPIQ